MYSAFCLAPISPRVRRVPMHGGNFRTKHVQFQDKVTADGGRVANRARARARARGRRRGMGVWAQKTTQRRCAAETDGGTVSSAAHTSASLFSFSFSIFLFSFSLFGVPPSLSLSLCVSRSAPWLAASAAWRAWQGGGCCVCLFRPSAVPALLRTSC